MLENQANSTPKTAVVFLNMGGPSELSEVKTFLNNMFNDSYILPIKSPLVRSMVANFITHARLEDAQKNYKKIGGKSPLVSHTFNLCSSLEKLDSSKIYTYAMRYTPPLAKMVAKQLQQEEVEKIVLFPLYPHFSYTTTQSSLDDFYAALKSITYSPKVYTIKNFYHDPLYNKAIIEQIKLTLKEDKAEDFILLFSAHSLPQKNIQRGDPYQKEIIENVEILKKCLLEENLKFKDIQLAYQSKLGPLKWLEPSTQKTIEKLRGEKIIVYPLAFCLDNSETDFELSILYREVAQLSGVVDYRVATCLNNSSTFMQFIIQAVLAILTNEEE